MSKVNIRGLDKVNLLRALWENQKPAAFFTMTGRLPPLFDPNEATKAVKSYIDYFCGRAIKSDLSGDEVDPYGYDRDTNEGAFAKISRGLAQ